MSRTLERCVAGMILALVLGAMVACNHPATPDSSLVPRHDAPFDVLPPEHIKSLEESRKAGR